MVRPWLVLLSGLALSAGAAAGPPESAGSGAPDPVERALGGLSSPFARERREAAADLAALLPGARGAVLHAWREGPEARRAALAPLLAREGSPEALALLVEGWLRGGEALGARAREALVSVPEAARAALERARTAPAASPPPTRTLDDLDRLLVRDEVERRFLDRRSRTGGTGYYRGQFASLAPRREMALEVCFHVLTDRALPLPGAPAVGGYRFLRPVNDVLDAWDVRELALSAVADLARPGDAALTERLAGYHAYLLTLPSDEEAGFGKGDPERVALLDGVLATLYRLDPYAWREALQERIAALWGQPRRFGGLVFEMQSAAALAARAGLYGDAIAKYEHLLAMRGNLSQATDCYNLACAYASWSLEEPDAARAARHRNRALDYLERAVDEQWSDLAWMEEDGDLDPLRASPRYRRIVERVKALLRPEPDAPAPR